MSGTASSSHAAVTVNDSADQILGVNSARRGATIVNNGSVVVYLGKSASVTTANGIPLAVGQSFTINAGEYLGAVFGVTASGSADVRYWEFA